MPSRASTAPYDLSGSNVVTQPSKLTFMGVVASVIIIAGGFYIGQLRGQLTAARQQSAAAQHEFQKLNATLGEAQSSLAEISKSQRQLEAELAQSKTAAADSSARMGQQVAMLQRQVSDLRAEISYRNKVSVWWRDLFDYTKPFEGASSSDAASVRR